MLTTHQNGNSKMNLIKNFLFNNIVYRKNRIDKDIINYIKKINYNKKLKYSDDLVIALFVYDKTDTTEIILEILKKQNTLDHVIVFIDGNQGSINYKNKKVIEIVNSFKVQKVFINNGKLGFRKQMITAMEYLSQNYEKLIFIEDDCIPSIDCIEIFDKSLENISKLDNIFSVYGSPFLVKNEKFGKKFPRFQGWGWGTTSKKLKGYLEELKKLYMLSETDYLKFIEKNLNYEIKKKIDITEKRFPSLTLTSFFAWDETLCLLTAKKNMEHLLTEVRTFYPIMHESSVHFKSHKNYKLPPFNMFYKSEIKEFLK